MPVQAPYETEPVPAVPVGFAPVLNELVLVEFWAAEVNPLHDGSDVPVAYANVVVADLVADETAGAVHDENDCIHEV